jgi:hypothetical protein
VSGSSYQVRAYNIKHTYNVNEFLEAYRMLLQKAVDEIWAEIRWIEKYDSKGTDKFYLSLLGCPLAMIHVIDVLLDLFTLGIT